MQNHKMHKMTKREFTKKVFRFIEGERELFLQDYPVNLPDTNEQMLEHN